MDLKFNKSRKLHTRTSSGARYQMPGYIQGETTDFFDYAEALIMAKYVQGLMGNTALGRLIQVESRQETDIKAYYDDEDPHTTYYLRINTDSADCDTNLPVGMRRRNRALDTFARKFNSPKIQMAANNPNGPARNTQFDQKISR